MMAAMMFASAAPTVALYSRMTKQRSPLSPLLFAAGYLATWASAGLAAFTLAANVHRISGDVLAWDRSGRWVAGTTLVVAAVYELTPSKTSASANAAARSASCSAPGGTATGARCRWARSTGPGASGVAGH
jgi:predicted metal-binding membrane protein